MTKTFCDLCEKPAIDRFFLNEIEHYVDSKALAEKNHNRVKLIVSWASISKYGGDGIPGDFDICAVCLRDLLRKCESVLQIEIEKGPNA